MKYKFSPMEFQKTLSNMGYGVGAGPEWWRALFKSLDVGEDGAVSLQDMYDALVLDLPPLPGQGGALGGTAGSVFFSGGEQGRSAGSSPSPQRAFSPNSPLRSTMDTTASRGRAIWENECQVCGAALSADTVFCRSCGTR